MPNKHFYVLFRSCLIFVHLSITYYIVSQKDDLQPSVIY